VRCPNPDCMSIRSEVVWSWLNTTGRVRVRKHRCLLCGAEWRTQETSESKPPRHFEGLDGFTKEG